MISLAHIEMVKEKYYRFFRRSWCRATIRWFEGLSGNSVTKDTLDNKEVSHA